MTKRYDVKIHKSPKTNSRFLATLTDVESGDVKKVHFGATARTKTFYDVKDDKKRDAYIARHSAPSAGQDHSPTGIFTAGWWSRWFLWETQKTNERKLKSILREKSGGKFRKIDFMFS